MNRNHHYFTNPKYMYTHVCIKRSGMWMVFERTKWSSKQKEFPLGKPIAIGTTQGEAIENASSIKGVKHYMIEVIE